MSGEGVGVLLGDQRKGIITMCIPIAVALLVQKLNNIVDSLWVSYLGGDSMAALGVVYTLYCVLIGIGNGLGIGVASAIARNIGRKDKANADGVAMQGLVLTVIAQLFLEPLLVFFGSPDNVLALAREYVRITSLGFPFLILTTGGAHLIRADGSPQYSMLCNLTGAVISYLKPERDPDTGRTSMVPTGEEFTYDCQLAFIAAGFVGCENYVADAFGVSLTGRGCVDTDHFRTNVEKVFACGDMRRGQSLVVWGLREGRDCAAEVDRYLMGYTNL